MDNTPALPRFAPETVAKSMRRLPSQDRAVRTIETIFQATAQIVETEGEAQLTTNKVAARAGFSIGTLYQYFPDKAAIIRAMMERGRLWVMGELDAFLLRIERMPNVQQADPQVFLREFIRINIDAFAAGKTFKRTMIRLCWQMEQPDQTATAIRETAERITICLQRIQHPALRPPTPALVFVLTRSVMGAIRSASLEKTPLLGSPEFEDELTALAWGLLRR